MKPTRDHRAEQALSPDLKVRVDRIPDEGLHIDEAITRDWIDAALGALEGKGSPFHAKDDGRLIVRLDKVERIIQVRGRARVNLSGSCVRCLGAVALALDVPVEVTMFPKGEEPPAGSEGELSADDMGVSSYDDGIVDLAGAVHDEVFLELPMNPVCSASCAGLCPTCGTNLNETRCGCAPAVDPRWQALRNLKD
jgi:uncharacterized protein